MSIQAYRQAVLQAAGRGKAVAAAFWEARSAQERQLLGIGAGFIVLALTYLLLLAPALDGRARLVKDLPLLRQQAATLQSLAREAAALSGQAPPQVAPMSRDSLSSSLASQGLTAQSVGMTGEYAKLRLTGVAFSSLLNWLDGLRRDGRIAVQDASIVAQPGAGLVDATLTLRQGGGGQK